MSDLDNNKPDELDRRIIRELRQDGRRPTKEIAETLGVTEATVASRIRGLNEGRVMRVMAQRNINRLRQCVPCFLFVSVRGRDVADVAGDIAKIERIASVSTLIGSPEIFLTGFVEEHTNVIALLQDEIGRIAGVDRLELILSLQTRVFRYDYAVLSTDAFGSESVGDELDDRIIEQLQIDGRISNREVARILDVPSSTVRERVNRMLANQVIRIGAVCDPEKLGLPQAGFVTLLVSPNKLGQALGYLQTKVDVGVLCSITGPHNIMVVFGAQDFSTLTSIINVMLRSTPGLLEMTSRIYSKSIKSRPDLIAIV